MVYYVINLKNLYWAAGFLEGEGTFAIKTTNLGTRRLPGIAPVIRCPQVQREPLDRLFELFQGKIYLRQPQLNSHHQPIYCWVIQGSRAIGIMLTIYNIMSPIRKIQIIKAIIAWRSRKPAGKYLTHCKYGHLLPKPNSQNLRRCKECISLQNKRSWAQYKMRIITNMHDFVGYHHCMSCRQEYNRRWYQRHKIKMTLRRLSSHG